MRHPTANSTISLPYNTSDAMGNQWTIYQNGMLQQRGNMPVFSQGAMLLIDGQMVQNNNGGNGHVSKDDKTGELVFDDFNTPNITVTRRILVRADGGYVRYIDTFKNNQAQPQSIDVMLQTRINFGVLNAQNVADPTNSDHSLAWVAQTQANRTIVVMTAGRTSKHPFSIAGQQDQNMTQADLPLTIPPNKEVAVMSVYTTSGSIDAGTQFVTGLKDVDLLKDCSNDLRREIVNFNTTSSFIGDREILRGTTLDVIELRSANGSGTADQLFGTLKDSTFTLHTFYGDVTMPADRVVSILTLGQFRSRQLLVTADGQVFGGTLSKDSISMALSSGQNIDVPLAQISRLGYRKRPDEPESGEATTQPLRAMVLLRSGDRIAIEPPAAPIDFLSRYGPLKLATSSVGAIAFQSDDNSVHTLYLTDGSHLSGLLQQQDLTVTLAGAPSDAASQPSEQKITIPAAAVARLQLNAYPAELDDQTPTLQLNNGDLLVGTISGQLKVDTAFDTLTVTGSEIHTMSHARDAGADIQISLWDQTRLSGSVQSLQIPCKLLSGTEIAAPVSLLDTYTQPQPQASPAMVQQIEMTVKDLSADDWKQREKAQEALIAMGPAIAAPLKSIAASQPPEAQERIAAILRKLSEKKKSNGDAP